MRHMRKLRRRLKQIVFRVVLSARVRIRRLLIRLRMQIARLGFLPWALVLSLILTGLVASLAYRNRVKWQIVSEALVVNGTLPQLEIAVGAAVLGVIGIVFSLSIFSIQQVAERGTALTIREYASDWVFRIVYWTLAFFAFLAMVSALQMKESAFLGVCLNLGILVATVLVLKVYFDRAIKFVDPHFTITKVAKRARKSLRQIQRLERVIQAEIRLQRTRRRT